MVRDTIALTGFGEWVEAGLSPRTKSMIGKKIKSNKEWNDLMNKLGTSHEAILTLKEDAKRR